VVESEEKLPLPAAGIGTVEVNYRGDSVVEMNVNTERGGFVVLHDTFMDGWVAEVDEVSSRVYAVNVLSRGVIVPPGRHRVVMTYSPPGFAGSMGLSAVALLILFLLEGRSAMKSRTGVVPE
jgi:uncharacterized membrane protein YfhO